MRGGGATSPNTELSLLKLVSTKSGSDSFSQTGAKTFLVTITVINKPVSVFTYTNVSGVE